MTATSAHPPVEPGESRGRATFWWNISIVLLVFSVLIFVFSDTSADADLWGHVQFGLDTVQAGGVIRTDPYSYLSTPGAWVNHELLAEVVMWLTYDALGQRGLVFLKLGLALTALLILFFHLLGRGVNITGAGLMLILSAPALHNYLLTVRPQLFTLIFFTLTMVILAAADRGRVVILWLLIPTFAAWINFHGGVLAGAGILVIWVGVRLLLLATQGAPEGQSRVSAGFKLVAPAIAAVSALLLNPFGPLLPKFLLDTATVARPEIADWWAMKVVSPMGATYLVLLAVTVLGLIFSRRRHSPALIVVYGCAAVMPFMAVRHLPLFVITALAVAGEHVYDAWRRWSPLEGRPMSSESPRWMPPTLAGLSGLIALILFIISWNVTSGIWIPAGDYPTRAIALIRESVPEGNLAMHFNWGQYAIWHLGPNVKVSLDGRRETVYSDDVYAENLRFMTGKGDWDALLDERPTDLALVRMGDAPYNLMLLKAGWVKVYEDQLSALFVPVDSPLRATIENAVVPEIPYDGEGMFFP